MGRRRWFRFFAMAVVLAVAGLVIGVASCGYIALPGGIIINFSNLPGSDRDPLTDTDLQGRLQLPEGFALETWATGLPGARMLLATEAGDLLVSTPRSGEIYLVERDGDGDGASDGVRVLIDSLDRPHGIAYRDGLLYVAEGSAIARLPFDPLTRRVGAPQRIVTGLPEGGNHWTRTVHIGPDEKLYVAIGSSCNVCEEEDPRRAAIVRYELDGSHEEIFATGLRNAVDFAWRPATQGLYAVVNGRDLLGDDYPPEEVNLVVKGGFYGWPYANPPQIPDPDFGALRPDKVAATIPPAYELPAHTAPLAIVFDPGGVFPDEYRGAAFVSLHGSWNRRKKQGYEVVTLFFGEDDVIRQEPFLTGFEIDEDVVGRPVGLAFGGDGALYIADDYTGVVYRVAYGEAPKARVAGPAAAAAKAAPQANPLDGLATHEIIRAAAAGATLWTDSDCASCHLRGEENSPPRLLGALGAKFDRAGLDAFLQAPQPPMPLYPFTATQRRNLSIYLFTRFR
ncbi:MAG: PQQ-dependent sugar dehydrogenase [Deltaproteobacteria bacterium]